MHTTSEALVFDFDGVIADTEPLYWRSWTILLMPLGVSLSWEEYCRIGRGVRDYQMLNLLPQVKSDRTLLSSLLRQKASRKEMVRKWSAQQSPIGSPTIEMLRSLKSFRLALVTSSERDNVESLLRTAGINDCFQATVFGEDTILHKPDPAPYILIQKRLGIETGVAFEDSDAGIESASKAGFSTIRVIDPRDLPDIVSKTLHRR